MQTDYSTVKSDLVVNTTAARVSCSASYVYAWLSYMNFTIFTRRKMIIFDPPPLTAGLSPLTHNVWNTSDLRPSPCQIRHTLYSLVIRTSAPNIAVSHNAPLPHDCNNGWLLCSLQTASSSASLQSCSNGALWDTAMFGALLLITNLS